MYGPSSGDKLVETTRTIIQQGVNTQIKNLHTRKKPTSYSFTSQPTMFQSQIHEPYDKWHQGFGSGSVSD